MIHQKDCDFRFKTEPRKHQLEVWNISKDREYYAIFHEPRTGKTKIILDTAMYLFEKKEIKVLIYIAPAGTIGEILNVQVPLHMDVFKCLIHRIKLAKLKPNLDLLRSTKHLLIVGINIEALSHKKGVDYIEKVLTDFGPSLMVVDESTTISNPKALRTKAVIKLGKLAKYRRIMTGTPIADSVLDLPSQIDFLASMDKLLGVKNWYVFRARYCELMPMFYGIRNFIKIIGPRRLDELMEKLRPYSSFIKLEQVIDDLPPKTYQRHHVEMDIKTKKLYKEMSSNFQLHLESGECSVATAATKLIRLMQITSGFYVDTNSQEKIEINNTRYIVLMDLIKTLPGKIVIWATFTYSINKICGLLIKEYGSESICRYDGQVSQLDREEQLNNFKVNGHCRFFVSNVRVGAYGLNLSNSSIAIYFNNSWSVEQRIQSENRLVSPSTKPLYIDMIMSGVDEKILGSLQAKKDLIQEIFANKSIKEMEII